MSRENWIGLIAGVIAIPLMIGVNVYQSLIIATIWNWYLPMLGAPAITWVHGFVFMILHGLVATVYQPKNYSKVHFYAHELLLPLYALLTAYLLLNFI